MPGPFSICGMGSEVLRLCRSSSGGCCRASLPRSFCHAMITPFFWKSKQGAPAEVTAESSGPGRGWIESDFRMRETRPGSPAATGRLIPTSTKAMPPGMAFVSFSQCRMVIVTCLGGSVAAPASSAGTSGRLTTSPSGTAVAFGAKVALGTMASGKESSNGR